MNCKLKTDREILKCIYEHSFKNYMNGKIKILDSDETQETANYGWIALDVVEIAKKLNISPLNLICRLRAIHELREKNDFITLLSFTTSDDQNCQYETDQTDAVHFPRLLSLIASENENYNHKILPIILSILAIVLSLISLIIGWFA